MGIKAMLRFIAFMTTVLSMCFSYQKDGKCYKSLNLIIALDASGSINTASWQSGINQSKQIIESFAVADSGNKFAIIEFSTFANVTYQLSSSSTEVINALVNKKDQINGGHTYIDTGLNEAIRIFNSLTGSQGDTQNVLLTVTDGFMTYRNGEDIFDNLKTPVEQLKTQNVELYAFSVGSLIKHKTLEFITTEPSSTHVFKSDQVGNLIEGIRKLTEAECPKIACSTVKVSRADKGCYKDNQQKQRPLPDLIFTDRDSGSSSYSGVMLDWKKWESYAKGLVCRCAEAVAGKGRSVFGLQYYGECWSSSSNNTYAIDGPAQDLSKCVSDTSENCNSTMLYCVGIQYHNFVYKIVS